MEQLDLVYNAFSNLEKNYARVTTKTREEYVKEKFGGDISIGSFLILNALGMHEFTEPEDIQKLSELREIFDFLKSNEDRLNRLTSFDYASADIKSQAEAALMDGYNRGHGFDVVSQDVLYQKRDKSFHHSVRPGIAMFTPMATSKCFYCYSPGMASLMSAFSGVQVSVGELYERPTGGTFKAVRSPSFVHNKRNKA